MRLGILHEGGGGNERSRVIDDSTHILDHWFCYEKRIRGEVIYYFFARFLNIQMVFPGRLVTIYHAYENTVNCNVPESIKDKIESQKPEDISP